MLTTILNSGWGCWKSCLDQLGVGETFDDEVLHDRASAIGVGDARLGRRADEGVGDTVHRGGDELLLVEDVELVEDGERSEQIIPVGAGEVIFDPVGVEAFGQVGAHGFECRVVEGAVLAHLEQVTRGLVGGEAVQEPRSVAATVVRELVVGALTLVAHIPAATEQVLQSVGRASVEPLADRVAGLAERGVGAVGHVDGVDGVARDDGHRDAELLHLLVEAGRARGVEVAVGGRLTVDALDDELAVDDPATAHVDDVADLVGEQVGLLGHEAIGIGQATDEQQRDGAVFGHLEGVDQELVPVGDDLGGIGQVGAGFHLGGVLGVGDLGAVAAHTHRHVAEAHLLERPLGEARAEAGVGEVGDDAHEAGDAATHEGGHGGQGELVVAVLSGVGDQDDGRDGRAVHGLFRWSW